MCLQKGLKHKSYEGSCGRKGGSEKILSLYNFLKGGHSQVGGGLFSQVTSKRMKGKGLKLCQGRFRLEIGKNFLMEQDAQGSG